MQTKDKWLYANLFAITLGILLRLREFLGCRSFWLDEVYAILNFQQYGFFELFQQAEHPHWSPIGFLASTRMLITLFGDSEYAYRLLPFIIGCISLFLFYRLTSKFLQPATTLYCNLLFSLSTTLIFYSNEFKPYILDTASGILLAIVLLPFLKKKLSGHEAVKLGLLGSLFVWFSFTIVFVMAGIGIVVAVRYLNQKDTPSLRNALLMIALWILSFSINYILFLKDIPNIPQIANYWPTQNPYMPLPPKDLSDVWWFIRNAGRYFENVAGIHKMGVFLFGCFCLGTLHFIKAKKYYILLFLTLPIAIPLLASAFKIYPFSSRLIIFTVPFSIIIAGASFEMLHHKIKNKKNQYIITLMAVSLLPLGIISANHAKKEYRTSQVRELLTRASVHMTANDEFVGYPYIEPFLYYHQKLEINTSEPRFLNVKEINETLISSEINDQNASIWLGFSLGNKADQEDILREFHSHFKEIQSFSGVGASLHQFKKP